MYDIKALSELNRHKSINDPETFHQLLSREFMVDGKIITPVLSPLRGNICQECILDHKKCNGQIFDDSGNLIPDCYEDYPKPIYYKLKT